MTGDFKRPCALYPHSFSHGTKLTLTTAGTQQTLLCQFLCLCSLPPWPFPSFPTLGNPPWPTVLQLDSALQALPGGRLSPSATMALDA